MEYPFCFCFAKQYTLPPFYKQDSYLSSLDANLMAYPAFQEVASVHSETIG